jgi:S1-C subfamily serine protease
MATHPFWRWVKRIAFALLAVAIAIGLFLWTKALQQKEQRNLERLALQRVLQREGESGLLDLAGVPVNNIFYGDEGVTLFEGDMANYRYSADEMQNISVYEMANKSVVHITTVPQSNPNTLLEVLPQQGTGSGIVISTDGYILTNAHVVADSSKLTIRLSDGSSHQAEMTGVDLENDLAVLKIEVPSAVVLTPIKFGTAASLKVGQKVMAIGNPFGYDRTMTIGMVSGLGRPVRTATNTVINGMIQTDAAINPGNSGGPLLNGRGEMVGICTTIHTTSGGSQGIGFAIPVDTAVSVIPDLIRYGKVVRGWLDITMVQLDASIVEYASLNVSQGILVSQVKNGGKAEKAGLKGGTEKVQYGSSVIHLGGDVIVAVNGVNVADFADLYGALKSTHPGDVVEVAVIRKGESKTLRIELVQRPETVEWVVR